MVGFADGDEEAAGGDLDVADAAVGEPLAEFLHGGQDVGVGGGGGPVRAWGTALGRSQLARRWNVLARSWRIDVEYP